MTSTVHQVDAFIADAQAWRAAVRDRAPSYHRVLEVLEALLGDEPGIAAALEEAWRERAFSVFYERPLLLLAALRFEALGRGEVHPLWPALRDESPDPACVSEEAVRAALGPGPVWGVLRDRLVQTNETSRAVAWTWPAAIAGCSDGARPVALVELGCAAGLNLVADGMPAAWSAGAGEPLEVVRAPAVLARIGIDRRPVHLDAESERFLRACIWAGERERLARLDAALAAFRAATPRPVLEVGDVAEAGPRLARVHGELPSGGLAIAFQTIVRDYLEAAVNEAYEAAMRGWLAACPRGAAVWLELEIQPDGPAPTHPVAIRAHLPDGCGGVADLVLGWTGYHPAEVRVEAEAVARFRELASAGV